jgi:hypothetical protein
MHIGMTCIPFSATLNIVSMRTEGTCEITAHRKESVIVANVYVCCVDRWAKAGG